MKNAFPLASLRGAQSYRIFLPTDRFPCNPSIARDGDGFLLILRTVNYQLERYGRWSDIHSDTFNTENWLVRLDARFEAVEKKKIDDRNFRSDERAARGLEDARLFRWREDWWFIASGLALGQPKTTMALCRLQGSEVAEVKFIPSPLNTDVEKNWMPLVRGEELALVYRVTPTSIVYCRGDKFEFRTFSSGNDQYPDWSGSSQCIPYGDHYLCVIHKRIRNGEGWRYEHLFLEIDCEFRVLRASDSWCFDEPTIEFCAGLCLTDTHAILSYGRMDHEARLISIPRATIERLLQERTHGFFPWAGNLPGRLLSSFRPVRQI